MSIHTFLGRFLSKYLGRPSLNTRIFSRLQPLDLSWKQKAKSTFSEPNQIHSVDEKGNRPMNNLNKYTNRTYTCGELGKENVGELVSIMGWLEYQRMDKFLVLRDAYGETQLIISDEDTSTKELLKTLPLESIMEVRGTVSLRPKNMVNENQSTGEIEVKVENLIVVNKVLDELPFNIRSFQKAKESLRMRYRYLDLRFSQMQRNLRVRSELLMKMREFLINNHFIDVETPTLFKATPGGAQEFIVPTRFPGQFYSLVQSPQQFKQMLMAGAIDRYFQIARCYRDEGTRPDRQPEFTQLDIELSFTSVEDILNLIEDLFQYCWPKFSNPIPYKFQRMSYAHAIENYGCDKPDIRFDHKIRNCTHLLKSNETVSTDHEFGAYYISFPKEYAISSRRLKESMSSLSKSFSRLKFVQSIINSREEWVKIMGSLLTVPTAERILDDNELENGSVLFLAYGNKGEVLQLLGKIRLEYVNFLENSGIFVRKKGMHFLWIVDFPMFEMSETTKCLQSAHHPFTAPNINDVTFLQTDPLKVRALAYDLILNGQEVGGGSIRIHDPSLQKIVLDVLKIDSKTVQHILNMLGSGCPPHGGIALGLDRLLHILMNTNSIRDVIAFPKNFEGRDPVSGAPSSISDRDKKLYHIKVVDSDMDI
ncbi:unnamed protein product [Phaedon cochleariae]|uniref:Aminoacyl-transfer RNA synthetases class-II family profile domain-containing protein n=1 Tax=Phaedon cochleariae TaxID=80249 RepID=A0A9P0DD04_PHACE|nr:unnamed protein product [Phaedon cochleariae]